MIEPGMNAMRTVLAAVVLTVASPAFCANDGIYDNTTATIGVEGCAVSSLATLNNFYRSTVSTAIPQSDPGALNAALRGLGNEGYTESGSVFWPGLNTLSGNKIQFVRLTDVDTRNSLQDVENSADADLALGRPVIMRVRRLKNTGTFGTHFVLAVGRCRGEYIIADPGSGTRTRFDPNDANFQLTGIRRFRPGP